MSTKEELTRTPTCPVCGAETEGGTIVDGLCEDCWSHDSRPQIGCLGPTGFLEEDHGEWTCCGCGAPVEDGLCTEGEK